MFRIALISYLVIICESDEFQKYSSHRDFAAKLSQSVLEAEHFPFFSLGMCKGKRDPHTLAKVAWWICSNNVLNNYCSKEMINLAVIKYQKGENCRLYVGLTRVTTHMLQPFHAECCYYIGDDFA